MLGMAPITPMPPKLPPKPDSTTRSSAARMSALTGTLSGCAEYGTTSLRRKAVHVGRMDVMPSFPLEV